MASITPIPTTRVSNQLMHQRLLTQLKSDQTELLRLQTALSTGRRISFASEDAPAATRGMSLQRLLERKDQSLVNLKTSQSYLGSTDSVLNTVSSMLNSARGTLVGVAGTSSSDTERQTAAAEIDRAVQQIVNSGNYKFRDRYLFAGSLSNSAPFEFVNGYVRYNGNELDLQNFVDTDLLLGSNVSGAEVFGALSAPVAGNDLNPIVTADTRLADLRGGLGVSKGSVAVSDGHEVSVVDLSKAETVGDVMKLLQANPPHGRTLSVAVTSTGLSLSLDAAGGGAIAVHEVGGGTLAHELGIFHPNGVNTGPLASADLNPRLALTTSLSNITGARAEATVQSAGGANDIKFTAKMRGAEFNDFTISFGHDGSLVGNAATVNYDPVAKTITVGINTGVTTASRVRDVLRADPALTADFDIELAGSEAGNNGIGFVAVSPATLTTGGAGAEFDQLGGLQIVNGGQTHLIDLSNARTVEDVLNTLNGSQASIMASLNETGTGINIRSRLSGSDFSIGENGGDTATQLGVRTFTGQTQLDSLNHGLGIHTQEGFDFTIRRANGSRLEIDVSAARTVQDVMDLINNHPNNADPLTKVTARLATSGNGIELVAAGVLATGDITITADNSSAAAIELGLIPKGQTLTQGTRVEGGNTILTGRDVGPLETNGVFNSLIRARDALQQNSTLGIEQAITKLDINTTQVSFVRGEIGARQQNLDVLQTRLEDESVELKAAISQEIEVDLPEVISQLMQRQAAYQASLQLAGQISQLTLLDFV